MAEERKSLGEFIADVLSHVGASTYIPAAVLAGGIALAGIVVTSDEQDPLEAIARAGPPDFAELALFVVVVALVAAVLEPLQFWITRVFEGYSRLFPAWSYWRMAKKRDALDEKRQVIGDRIEVAHAVLVALSERPATVPWAPSGDRRELLNERRQAVAYEIAQLERQKRNLSDRLRSWPAEDDRLLPTRLGNVIRHFEDRANEILGGSTDERLCGATELQEVLPLVHSRLPGGMAAQHDFFRAQLQTTTALMMVIPIVGVLLTVAVDPIPWSIAVGLVTAAMTAAAYSGARSAADGYGTMLVAIAEYSATTIDLRDGTDRAASDAGAGPSGNGAAVPSSSTTS